MAIVLAMPALSAALSLAREKEQGSLEGLMATPIRRYQLLAGKVIPYLLVGLLDVFLFTLVGMITFGVPFRGSLVDLVLASSLFLLANLGIGLLISSLVRTQMAALLIAGLIFDTVQAASAKRHAIAKATIQPAPSIHWAAGPTRSAAPVADRPSTRPAAKPNRCAPRSVDSPAVPVNASNAMPA